MTRTPTETWAAYLEVWNGFRPLTELDALLADEYAGQVGSLLQDKAALRSRIDVYRTAHPTARFEVLDQFAAGDRLVTRLQVTGLSGQEHPLLGINVGLHRESRLAQEWAVWETH
ncbi:MAG: SnoaL-like polyketide cyclase [Frankiales bacterium]|nr:SnoaL-like polyketide cyclase [Frankiales bacterium]